MSRRAFVRYGELTSLIDVMFILMFAALIQLAASKPSEEPLETNTPPDRPDAGPPPRIQSEEIRAAALSSLGASGEILVRVSGRGAITEIEYAGKVRPVDIQLVQRIADERMRVTYLGDTIPNLQICNIVRAQLGIDALEDKLVIVSYERAGGELEITFLRGLLNDKERCHALGAIAVVIDGDRRKLLPPETETP